jgi:ubiquilin
MDSLPDIPAMDSQMPSEFNSPMMREMLRNPQMIEMMTRMMGNPDVMNAMIESNPQLKQFLDSQPGSREMLRNPAVLQQSISMMQRLAHAPVPGDQSTGFAAPGSAGAPTSPSPAQPFVQPPTQGYAAQLQQMRDMGFTNDQANLEALAATGGNVEAAIERLLRMLGN